MKTITGRLVYTAESLQELADLIVSDMSAQTGYAMSMQFWSLVLTDKTPRLKVYMAAADGTPCTMSYDL